MKLFRIGLGLLILGLAARYSHAADVKISALPDGGTVQTTDQIPVNRSGTTDRVVVGFLATVGALSGDCTTPGNSGVLTCGTAIARTGVDIDTSNQVTVTHLAAPLPATQGGTGQTTITLGDLIYGSASNVLSKLAGNTTTTKQFLGQTGNGTISAAPVWGALTAGDFQGLSPVWTGNQEIASAEPRYILTETDQGADLKKLDIDLQGGVLCVRTRTDLDAAGQNAICFTRGPTTSLTNITLGYATSGTYTFPFTGTATFGGAITLGGSLTVSSGNIVASSTSSVIQGGILRLTGSGTTTNGLNLPTANTLGFLANTTQVGTWDTTKLSLNTGLASTGTKFTASGCSNSATVGGAIAGQFTSGTTGTCTVVITLPTTLNGWVCRADDLTTPANFIGQSASSTTSCTVTGTTVSGDVLNFSAMAF